MLDHADTLVTENVAHLERIAARPSARTCGDVRDAFTICVVPNLEGTQAFKRGWAAHFTFALAQVPVPLVAARARSLLGPGARRVH